MSRSFGRSKAAGSRFAEPNSRASSSPLGTAAPQISASSSTQRSNIWSGVSYRISSSTALGTSERSERSISSWSGLRNRAHQPFPVTLTVASWPALRIRTQVPIISSSVSRSPWSTTRTSSPIRSGVGSRRRSRIRARRYSENSTAAAEMVPIRLRDAQQLGDHRHRERLGDLLDQIELSCSLHLVDQAVHQSLDRRTKPVDHLRREGLDHQAANPGVIRRLHVQDPVPDQVPELAGLLSVLGPAHLLVRGLV